MPKIHTILQGDTAWLKLRVGKVTASEASNLLTPEFKLRTGEMPHTYLCEKVAEAWRGEPLPGFSSWATEQGAMLEDEARAWYALEHDDFPIQNVGFVETDDGRAGCSPDALLGDEGGLELKAPEPTNHVRYLLGGELPKQYVVQVHFSMWVTGRPWWRFVSYRRGFPAFVLHVQRDEKICEKIEAAVAAFSKEFDAAMAKLKGL